MTATTLPVKGAGSKIDAAYTALIKANFDELIDPWTSYTPVVTGTGWVVGNAGLAGGWIEFGDFIVARFTITIGSTTTVGTGAYSITLPTTAAVTDIGMGWMTIRDSSVPAVRQRNCYANTTTTLAAQAEDGTFVTGTTPFALATSDTLKATFLYQAA